jgi:glycosyltransferase involved in cell wall biosynthesis
MIKLGLVLPCYNEEEVLNSSFERLRQLFEELRQKEKITEDSFALFVNDGSADKTWSLIQEAHKKDSFIKGLNLAANVGHQYAIMAGMMEGRSMADAVITIDADLQDDLNAIEQMIDKHEAGADIVYGVKVSRQADSKKKRFSAQLYYRMLAAMGVKTIYNHADFRLLSKTALNTLALYPERNLYLRGLITQMGFQSDTVEDVISPRIAGSSKYTLRKMLRLASDGITSFSTRPIDLILQVGILMMGIAFLMFLYVIVSLCMNHYVAGWASIMMSLWFIGAVVTLSIGVVGLYIGKIYIEVKRRPLYTVKEKIV